MNVNQEGESICTDSSQQQGAVKASVPQRLSHKQAGEDVGINIWRDTGNTDVERLAPSAHSEKVLGATP